MRLTPARPEILQGAKLKLFDGATGASEGRGDLANRSILGKPHPNDAPLIVRKRRDESEESGALG
jgi:hypothetical protein